MSLEEKIDELLRTISHGSRLGLHRKQWEMFQKGQSFWKDAIIDLVKEEIAKARLEDFANNCNACSFCRTNPPANDI